MIAPGFVLRIYYFVAFGALGLYLPYFPSWLEARGFSGGHMSALVTLMPICQLLSPSLVGMLSDRWGLRGRMMTFCGATTALGMSLLGWSSGQSSELSFLVVWASLLLFAALRGPSVGLADVLAMETGKNYGRLRLWGSLGFMCMAVLGGRFIDVQHAYALPTLIAALLWLLVGVSTLLPRTSQLPTRPVWSDVRGLLEQKSYRQLLVTMTLIFIATSAYDLCATLRLTQLGATGPQIGGFWGISTLSEVGFMFFGGRIIGMVGPGKLLTLACAVGAARWWAMASISRLPWLFALQPLHAITFGLMWLSAIQVLKREVGVRGTATAHGLFSSAIAVGNTVGLSIWSVLFERAGGAVVFGWAGLMASLAVVSAARLIRVEPTPLAPAWTRSRA